MIRSKQTFLKLVAAVFASALMFTVVLWAQQANVSNILEGTAEVVGDPQVLSKAARESWKKACEDWKKEVKDLNRENDGLVLNCNKPECAQEGPHTVCKSNATYKVVLKVKN